MIQITIEVEPGKGMRVSGVPEDRIVARGILESARELLEQKWQEMDRGDSSPLMIARDLPDDPNGQPRR